MRIPALIVAAWAAWIAMPCAANVGKHYVKEDISLSQGGVPLELISGKTLAGGAHDRRYSVRNLLDGNAATAWVTRAAPDPDWGDGDGQLRIVFKKPVYLKALIIRNGYQKSAALFRQNQRVKTLSINKVLIGGSGFALENAVKLKDRRGSQKISLQKGWSPSVNLFRVKALVLRIDAVYPGSKYADLCISGITLVYADRSGFTPPISFAALQTRIRQHEVHTLHGWDWHGLNENGGALFTSLLYYAASGNRAAYALFGDYAPDSTMDSEELDAIWKPAVDATRALRHEPLHHRKR